MALVAAGAVEACGDVAGGNLSECVGSLKAMNYWYLCKTQASTPNGRQPEARHK